MATSQPATSTCLRPKRSAKRPAQIVRERLGHTEHDDEREDRRAGGEMESCSAIAGRMLRSMPTMAPTNALTTTSSENCAAFSRKPSRMTAGRSAPGRRHACAFAAAYLD